LRVSREEFIQAIADEATAQGKRQTADLIDQSLASGRLDSALRTTPTRGRTARAGRASSSPSGFFDSFKGIDSLQSDNARDLFKASEERMRLLNKANEDQWAAQRKAIEQNREYEYQLMESNLRKEIDARAAQLQTLSGLYESLFRGGTRAIWDDFDNIGKRVVSQVLARFTLAKITGESTALGGKSGILSTALHAVLGFADGGRPPLGRVSVVGERGPELFVPDVAGTIIPNHALGGGGAVVVNITAPGATAETIAAIRREIFNAAPAIAAAATGQTTRLLNRRTL
jgi:hypothetical protein